MEARDLGNNFLLDKGALGKSRAQAVTENLKELNPNVSGSFVEDTVDNVMASNVDFFQPFKLVIATQVRSWTRRELHCNFAALSTSTSVMVVIEAAAMVSAVSNV